MIDGDKALEYLKNKLINLINKGEINATYEQSNTTISFYISDIVATNRPLLSLRLSNHHENFNNRKRQRGVLPQGDSNISIELYKPLKGKKNKVKTGVTHYYSVEKPQIIPFSVTTIEYIPQKMYPQDVNLIYQSILNWIRSGKNNAVYVDPLKGTSRQADIETNQAQIKLKREVTTAEYNFYKRYGLGDSITPRYNIIKENNQKYCNRNMRTNKKVVRLTESKLKQMIAESVRQALKEVVQPEYFVKCVECYTKGGQDIVFVAALSETGGDGPAIRRVMKNFPNLEIIGVSDVSGSIKIGDMTRIQHQFCNDGGVMIVDDAIRNVDDLEWHGNVDDLEFDEY